MVFLLAALLHAMAYNVGVLASQNPRPSSVGTNDLHVLHEKLSWTGSSSTSCYPGRTLRVFLP